MIEEGLALKGYALLYYHFIHHSRLQCFIYPVSYFFLLVDQFIFQGAHGCSDDQFISDDLEFVSVTGNRLPHDIFPDIFDLHSLYTALDPAAVQELL